MFQNIIFLLLLSSINVINGVEYISEEIFSACPDPDDFRCTSGNLCIKPELECDGKNDCPDGSDEFEAECDFKLCKPPHYYTCQDGNGTCIIENFRCDGHNDCPLSDDEENCKNYVPHHEKIECNINDFTCLMDNMCLPMELVCDGVRQCIDGSDETLGCLDIDKKCKGFLCKNNHCINDMVWVCDGENDCGDFSDEKDCAFGCTADNKKFLCHDNTTCLSIEKACNNQQDCKDGSDEGGICKKFANNTDCESHYCPNEAECFIWPTGPICVCPKGFFYNTGRKMCEDIDECQKIGVCSQGCVNTQGSYYCTCVKRFRLKGDNKTCETISRAEPVMFYAGKKSVNLMYLRSNHRSVVTDKVRQVIGISFDGTYVYWTNVAFNSESINKAREDGTKQEIILTTGLSLPEDVAVDWFTGNIYFTDAYFRHIAVCSNDGRHCASLVTEGVEGPRSIALYPQEGRMYWSEWGSKPMISVSRMDGSFASPFIDDDIQWPSGVTLDWPNNRLYWVDAKLSKIESCNLDGTGRRTVIGNVLKHPYGLAVFEDDIYWSDWDAMSIESCNKFTCKNRKTLLKDRKVYDLYIYHNSIQPRMNNPCSNNNCTHLCLLASNVTFTCACPNEMKLNVDQLSCSALTKKESIYIGMRNYLVTIEHESFGRHALSKAKVLPIYIHKMAFNLLNGHVFIADNIARIIYDYEMTKEETTELVTKYIGKVSSLAFDHFSNNLYWSDSEHGTIEILSLNTNNRGVIHHYSAMEKPISIALIPEQGQIYVALKSNFGHSHIDVISMDGSGDHHHFIEDQLGTKQIHFVVDKSLGEIFWTDSSLKQISWSDFTGKGVHVFKSTSGEPISLAILSDDVFWAEKGSLHVHWTVKHSPDVTRQLILPQHDFVTKDDQLVLISVTQRVVVNHPCMVNNGNCSHICTSNGTNQKVCICPPGMVFVNNENSTCMEAVDCEFRCGSGECITASRVCNSLKDCVDASDEKSCAKTISCSTAEFKCEDGKQCIPLTRRCDKSNDCKDKSDEVNCDHFIKQSKCHANQYACPSGLCIDLTAVCDHINDCEDGAEELNCDSKNALKDACPPSLFTCVSGQCIPTSWVCDDSPDCVDGSDEYHCPEKACQTGYVKCSHGQCIDSKFICDGVNNCGDNSDEINCTRNDISTASCEEFDSNNNLIKFQCASDKRICLDAGARCNGTAECPRGEDEANCSGCRITEFECNNKKCIRNEWRCDKVDDCGDRSDEIGCDKSTNTTITGLENCQVGMFDCKDGHCIESDKVCDGKSDCPSELDESSKCAKACEGSPCQQICKKSPLGPVCSCRDGYTLSGDHKSCFDVNECTKSSPCAQICVNLEGSFRCSCYDDYMLRSDKLSCKSIGGPKHILYSAMSVIYDMSESTFGILWSSNGSKIVGMDANVKENLLYFTVEDTAALYEMNLETKKVTYATNIGNPRHLGVDWISNNVYFFDQDSNPSIKICHMANKACAQIIQLKYRDVVKALIVDSWNKKIFYSVLHSSFRDAESIVYSHNLDGSQPNILFHGSAFISGLANDINKKLIYFSDLPRSKIWSMKYDGSDQKLLIENNRYILHPSDMNVFEDHILVLNTGSKMVALCQVYGDFECKSVALNEYNPENLVITQESRQKGIVNSCEASNCSLLCVRGKSKPKCLCHEGIILDYGTECKDANQVGMSPIFALDKKTTESHTSAIGIVFIVFAVLIGLSFVVFGAFYVYRNRFTFRKTFDISMHFENPSSTSASDTANVKMFRPQQSGASSQYNEIYLNTQVPSTPVEEERENNFATESDTVRLIY